MGSTGVDDSSQIAIEGELMDTGGRLLSLPPSTNELLSLLEKAESLLARVWQQPPLSTRRALLPIMKAMITKEIMHHSDVNVQVVLASCFDDLSRISAPDAPYPDEQMRVFFRLFMVAFQQLTNKIGRHYSRAMKMIETIAKVRSGLMLLDIDNEGLAVEMFQSLLNNIRPSHPRNVFKNMESIISSMVQESEEISFELLKPLLDSVKKENKMHTSFELGKKIFQNCASKVQTFLKESIKGKNLDPDEYDEIITSLLSDTSNGENLVQVATAQTAGETALELDVSDAKHKDCIGASGEDGTKLVSENSFEMSKGSKQMGKPGTDLGASRRKRGRKPNSVIRPEEGYQHTWSTGDKYSAEISCDHNNQKRKEFTLPSQVGEKGTQGDLMGKNDSPKVVGHAKRGRPRKKENIINEHNDQEKLKNREVERAKTKPSEEEKEKEKKPRRPRVDYGEEMISQRIQVWWPMDETYYTGTVVAFDPEIKKHTILYDDDEIEVLNLRKEVWERFSDEQLYRRQEAKHPSPSTEPLIETEERSTKKKALPSKKQTILLSKRFPSEFEISKSKGESTSAAAGENSETDK